MKKKIILGIIVLLLFACSPATSTPTQTSTTVSTIPPGFVTARDGAAILDDPRTNTWTPTSYMVNHRLSVKAVLLPNGRVLEASGNLLDYPNFSFLLLLNSRVYTRKIGRGQKIN